MSDREYYDLVNNVANLAGKRGYWMVGVGAEPERVADRQHQLVAHGSQRLEFTGTADEVLAHLVGL